VNKMNDLLIGDTFHIFHTPRNVTLILFIFAIAQVVYVGYVYSYYLSNAYLPSPFLLDKSDTFMDLYNPMYWSDKVGRYTVWGSVYPPLNFLILRLIKSIFIGASEASAYDLRSSSYYLNIFIVIVYFAIMISVVVGEYWKNIRIIDKALISIIASLSFPALFAMERGNLIIFSIAFLPLLFSKRIEFRIIAISILINMKPYFVLLGIVYIISRKYKELAIIICGSGILFIITSFINGYDSFFLLRNMFNYYASGNLLSVYAVMDLSSSISSYAYVVDAYIEKFGDNNLLSIASTAIKAVKYSIIFYCIGMLLLRQPKVSRDVLFVVAISIITNSGISVGGYSLIYYIPTIPIIMTMRYRYVYALSLAIMAFPPYSFNLMWREFPGIFSFLGGTTVSPVWMMDAVNILKPMINTVLLLTMTWEISSSARKRF